MSTPLTAIESEIEFRFNTEYIPVFAPDLAFLSPRLMTWGAMGTDTQYVNYRQLEAGGLLVGSEYRRLRPVDCIARAQRLTTPARDIHSAVDVGVHEIPAGFADELMFTTRANRITDRASLGRVRRVNEDHGNACGFGFVLDLDSQVVESPTAEHLAHSFAFCGSLANAGQVFESNSAAGLFGRSDDLPGDLVIDIGHHALLLATKPFQGAFATLRAVPLQAAARPLSNLSQAIDRATGHDFAIRSGGDAIDSEINAKRVIRIAFRRLRDFNHEVNVKSFLLFVVDKMSRCRFLAFKQMSLIIAQLKLDLLTALNRGNRNRLGLRDEANQVFIQIKRSRAKLFRRALLAERLSDAANRPDDVIGSKTGRGFDDVVTQTVNVERAVDIVLLRNLQRLIASFGVSVKRGFQRFGLSLTWFQFGRYSLTHTGAFYHTFAEFQEGIVLRETLRTMRNSPAV